MRAFPSGVQHLARLPYLKVGMQTRTLSLMIAVGPLAVLGVGLFNATALVRRPGYGATVVSVGRHRRGEVRSELGGQTMPQYLEFVI